MRIAGHHDISPEVAATVPALVELRRDIHSHPELGFHESRTAAVIAERLADAGLTVETGVGQTGVVGVLRGAGSGPALMVRADIDALPVREETGLPFASTSGTMHACGHDGHVAIAVTAAEVLAANRAGLGGRIVFVFQPAEEVLGGAQAMIDDGLFDRYPADRIVGLHLSSVLPSGTVAVNPGPFMAGSDRIGITVTGKGGHGATPELAVDPVVVAAHVVTALQTLVSRELPPNEPGVVTIGELHAGTAGNVIADRATMTGTVRSFSQEARRTLLDGVERTAAGVAASLRARADYQWLFGAPAVVNDPAVAAFVHSIAEAVVGPANVGPIEPLSGADDMSLFLNRVRGCYFMLGAARSGRDDVVAHHSARFDFDEAMLPLGVELFVRAARTYLR